MMGYLLPQVAVTQSDAISARFRGRRNDHDRIV
jgi:hypothetical protein